MDCCNYVQPYPGHNHFYQQQQQQNHHFCYDNMNGYAGYSAAPISDAIEANARYTRLQAAYPTDYVYNPKEARLRKAMREQNRELSRQSILSASTSSSTPDNTSSTTTTTTTSPIDQSRSASTTFTDRPMTCSLGPVSIEQNLSSIPESSPYISGRIVNPWFPITHTTPAAHLNSMLSHRMMQAHQRTFDKTKEALKKQASLAECGKAFSSSSTASCYPGDFPIHGSSSTQSMSASSSGDTRTNEANLESNDYSGIGEFTDGQKWHPYQSSPTQYHSRSGSITKISNRHGTIQNVNHVNNHVQGPWNQFCGIPMSSMAAQNPLIPHPRQMVLLQQQQERQCGFHDEISMPYVTSKIDLGGQSMPSGYPQSNYQNLDKGIDEPSKWQNGNNDRPMDSMMIQHTELLVKEEQSQQPKTEEKVKDHDKIASQKSKIISKQPLPGFHQAFGSTEIGRFSRTEFFANMVNENGVSSTKNYPSGSSVASSSSNDESVQNCLADSAENFNGLPLTPNYEGIRNSKTRWHSPYVAVISGEI